MHKKKTGLKAMILIAKPALSSRGLFENLNTNIESSRSGFVHSCRVNLQNSSYGERGRKKDIFYITPNDCSI